MKKFQFWILITLGFLPLFSACSNHPPLPKTEKPLESLPIFMKAPPLPTSLPASQPAVPESQTSTTQPAEPTSLPTTLSVSASDDQILAKTNGYIECFNHTIEQVSLFRRLYFSVFNEKTGPTCREVYVSLGIHKFPENVTEICNKALNYSKPAPPPLPLLDQAISDLISAYTELAPLTAKITDYFDQQDFKDDHCAKGREMHPKFVAALNRFENASDQLSKGLDEMKQSINQRELARLEKEEGRKLEWHTRTFLMQAKRLTDTLPKGTIRKTDTARYLQEFTELEKSQESLTNYLGSHPDEKKAALLYDTFENEEKDFFKQAKFLKRDFSESENPHLELLRDFIQKYNSMITWSNNIRFHFSSSIPGR